MRSSRPLQRHIHQVSTTFIIKMIKHWLFYFFCHMLCTIKLFCWIKELENGLWYYTLVWEPNAVFPQITFMKPIFLNALEGKIEFWNASKPPCSSHDNNISLMKRRKAMARYTEPISNVLKKLDNLKRWCTWGLLGHNGGKKAKCILSWKVWLYE